MFKGFKLIISMLLIILLIGTISALSWDNKIDYENNDMTIVFENAFGLPLIGDVLGRATLTSHTTTSEVRNVIAGKNRVPMYYEFKDWKKVYKDGLGEVEFTDMNNGEEINKEYKFVYAVYEEYDKPTYETNCREEIINYPNESSSIKEVCDRELVGYVNQKRFKSWEELTNKNIPKEKTRIGIMVDVERGEHIDAVWTIAGKKVKKHAEWTDSFYVSLVSYYKLDEEDTTGSGAIIDELNANNGVNVGADNVSGKITTAYDFVNINGDHIDVGQNTIDFTTQDMTINAWVNINEQDSLKPILASSSVHDGYGFAVSNDVLRFQRLGVGGEVLSTDKVGSDTWSMVTITYDQTANIVQFYINGTADSGGTDVFGLEFGGDEDYGIGSWGTTPRMNGSIDEVGVWSRVLNSSEVTNLWNGGAGITPNLTLNITLRELGNINYHVKDTNLTINWTVTNPDTCILEYAGVNTTLPCSRNYTEINITSHVNKTVILWVNNTVGNANTSSMNWDYYIFENSIGFNNETIEGSIEPFNLNITNLGSITISAINLNYNNTNNLAVFTGANNIYATANQIIPRIDNITDITFYWEFLLSDSTIIRSFNHTQQIKNIRIDDCSVFTTLIYNYTLLDEEDQTVLSGDDLEVEIAFSILSYDGSLSISNYSTAVNGTNPVQICTSLPLSSTQYQGDAIVKYTNLGYVVEYYNIVNFTLTNTTIPKNINLYDLNSNDSTEFQLTFTGSDFLPVENALVYVNRQYISENLFKTVELPKTDSNGQTLLHLVRNDVIYNIIIIKDGVVLGTFENLIAFCEDFTIEDCTMSLNALSEVGTIYNVDEDLGIVFTIPTYDTTSREISFSYVSDDGTPKTVLMDITRRDIFGNRSVCNDTLISAAGTLICTVGANIEDSTLRTIIYVNGDEIVVTSTKIDKSNYGAAGYLVFFFMAISFIFMFSTSKTGVLFGIGLSFLAAVGLGLITGSVIGLGAAGLWLILILVLAIWKLNKERVQ